MRCAPVGLILQSRQFSGGSDGTRPADFRGGLDFDALFTPLGGVYFELSNDFLTPLPLLWNGEYPCLGHFGVERWCHVFSPKFCHPT